MEPDLTFLFDPRTITFLFDAARTSNWRLLAVLALVAVVWGIRAFGSRAWPALASDRGGALLALIGGITGAICHAALAGAPVTRQLVLEGVVNGVTAAGGWAMVRKLWGAKTAADVKDDAAAAAAVAPPTTMLLAGLALGLAACDARTENAALGVSVIVGFPLLVLAVVYRFDRLALVALLALSSTGCTAAYVTAGMVADGITSSIGGYTLRTAGARRAIAAQHPECSQTSDRPRAEVLACREAALAPFEAKQVPVLECIEVAAPLVDGARAAVKAKDAKAALVVIPQLAPVAAQCASAIEHAKEQP